MPEDDLRIVRVELTEQSRKVWRDLNNDHPLQYPVLLWLSRSLDDFERLSVKTWAGMTVGIDAMTVLLTNTTLEAVRDQLGALNGKIANAATRGRQMRDAAFAEDDRLLALEAEINDSLGNPNN
jgi:hypothetical protein